MSSYLHIVDTQSVLSTIVSISFYVLVSLLSAILLLSTPIILLALVRLITIPLPKSISWPSQSVTFCSPSLPKKLLLSLSEFTQTRSHHRTHYPSYKPFILPGIQWPSIVLPQSESAWIARQSEDVLSGTKVLEDMMGTEWLGHGMERDFVTGGTVKRGLMKLMGMMNEGVVEEVRRAIDHVVEEEGKGKGKAKGKGGNVDGWKEVSIMKMAEKVTFRAVTRGFVGMPFCRDERFEKNVTRWMIAFGITTTTMRFMIPEPLKGIVMPMMAWPASVVRDWTTRDLRREIQRRIEKMRSPSSSSFADENDDNKAGDQPPNDMLQFLITTSSPTALDPKTIASKFLFLNIFSTATTMSMTALTLASILSYENAAELLEELREEAEQYLSSAEGDKSITPISLRGMRKMDSTIRESLRMNPFGAGTMLREVVAENGATTSPGGVYLPKGTHVLCNVMNMHRDASIQGDGSWDTFEPLRYHSSSAHPIHETSDQIAHQLPSTQLSPTFLPFGLGRHACPGRFFAVQLMKLIIGDLVTRYEILPLEEKFEEKTKNAEGKWEKSLVKAKYFEIGEGIVLSDKTEMKLRKRTVEEDRNGKGNGEGETC